MNAPIGGFGGRTSRYTVGSLSNTIIGNIQPGSIIINESASAVVYFGDSSVSPQTGIALRPGNTCTWQYDGACYAIVDETTGTEATIVVSNMVSDIDRTTNDTDDGIVLLEKSLIAQDVYHDTYEIRTSPYPSMILELVNLSPGEYESAEVSFIDPPTTYDYSFGTAGEPNDTATAYYPVAGQIAHVKVAKSKADNDYILNVWGMKQYVGDKARPTELPPDPPPNFETIDSTQYNGGSVGDINLVLSGNGDEFASYAVRLSVVNSGSDGIIYEVRSPFSNVVYRGRIYDTDVPVFYMPVIDTTVTITLIIDNVATTATAQLYGSRQSGDASQFGKNNLEPVQTFKIVGGGTDNVLVTGMSKYAGYIVEFVTVSTVDPPDPVPTWGSVMGWQTLPGTEDIKDFSGNVTDGYRIEQHSVTGDKLHISAQFTPADTLTTISVYGLRVTGGSTIPVPGIAQNVNIVSPDPLVVTGVPGDGLAVYTADGDTLSVAKTASDPSSLSHVWLSKTLLAASQGVDFDIDASYIGIPVNIVIHAQDLYPGSSVFRAAGGVWFANYNDETLGYIGLFGYPSSFVQEDLKMALMGVNNIIIPPTTKTIRLRVATPIPVGDNSMTINCEIQPCFGY